MNKSFKAVLSAGVLGSVLFLGVTDVGAEDLGAESKVEVEVDDKTKSATEKLGKFEDVKIDAVDELKSKQIYEREIKNTKASINELRDLKEVYKNSKEDLSEDIDKLNGEIEVARNKIKSLREHISKKEIEINETQKKLIKLYAEIEEMEKEKSIREEDFKSRVVSIQKNKEIGVLDVLLSSDSFVDMVNRFFSYKTIVNADNKAIEDYLKLIDRLEKTKEKTEDLKDKLEKDLDDLNKKKINLENEKKSLDDLLVKKERQSMTVEDILKDIDKDIVKLKNSIDNLTINKNKASVMEELAEKVKKERAGAFSNKIYRYADLSSDNSITDRVEKELKEGKKFITPAVGRFTSGYGPRVVMGEYGVHYGIDIANKTGTGIMAAADGVVIHASPMGGYGNVVFLSHNIDGKNYVTVYGHMSMIGVKVGDVVKQTQTIGLVGSTGRSTGPHIHFEIHENTSKWNTSKSVDPWKYLTSNLSDEIVMEGFKEIDKIKDKFGTDEK